MVSEWMEACVPPIPHERDLATGDVEALLLCLSEMCSVVNVELGIVDERISNVVVFRGDMFLLSTCSGQR